jgi:hypothetical protein
VVLRVHITDVPSHASEQRELVSPSRPSQDESLSFSSPGLSGLFGKKEMRILTVGLHAAGKTTILYELTLGDLLGKIVTTIPTISLDVETSPSPLGLY